MNQTSKGAPRETSRGASTPSRTRPAPLRPPRPSRAGSGTRSGPRGAGAGRPARRTARALPRAGLRLHGLDGRGSRAVRFARGTSRRLSSCHQLRPTASIVYQPTHYTGRLRRSDLDFEERSRRGKLFDRMARDILAAIRDRDGPMQPRASEFVFARLRYESGDWDYNPKVAANVLNSVVEYTTIPVYPEEVVITASSEELLSFPFLFMTGHKLVRFSAEERDSLKRVRRAAAGCCSRTTATTTSTGCTRGASSRRCGRSFGARWRAAQAAGAASALPQLLHFRRRAADDVARAERLGRRHRARLPARASSTAAGSACCTATRTTAASGTTTGGTSASSGRTTRSSRSTSSCTR